MNSSRGSSSSNNKLRREREEYDDENITPRYRTTSSRPSADNLSLRSNASLQSLSEMPPAKSPYGSFMQTMRRVVPQDIACKVGCNGAKCKYCNAEWTEEEMAINGVYSHWITDDILAMARPTENCIKKHRLIHQLKSAEIRSLFNLQTRGEHKDCGTGVLKESGFSYDPSVFIQEDIYYYNYEMEDYNIANMETLIDIVKVVCFALSEGKVAVHCHAGLGRTGLLISCYLVYSQRMTADQAIHYIRLKRKNSVQMTDQINAARNFEKFLQPMRVVFTRNSIKPMPKKFYLNDEEDEVDKSSSTVSLADDSYQSTTFTLNAFLSRQKYLLHGKELKKLRYIPKIIYACGEQLKRLVSNWQNEDIDSRKQKEIQKIVNEYAKDLYETTSSARLGNGHSRNSPSGLGKDKDILEPNIMIARALALNHFSPKIMKRLERYQRLFNESNEAYDEVAVERDPVILTALIWSWLDQLEEPVLRDQEIKILLRNLSRDSLRTSDVRNSEIRWAELDKSTTETTIYLIGMVNSLLPLPEQLENDVFSQLLSSLTHTKIDLDDGVGSETARRRGAAQDDVHYYPNVETFMKRQQARMLHAIFKDISKRPVEKSEKALGKFNFKKNVSYSERDREQLNSYRDDMSYEVKRNRGRDQAARYHNYDEYFDVDDDKADLPPAAAERGRRQPSGRSSQRRRNSWDD